MVVENLAFHNGPEQYLSLEICPVAFPWHFYVTKPTEWGNANFFVRINSSWLFILCIVTTTFIFTFHFYNEINKKLWFYTLKLLLGNFFFPISTRFHSCSLKFYPETERMKWGQEGFEIWIWKASPKLSVYTKVCKLLRFRIFQKSDKSSRLYSISAFLLLIMAITWIHRKTHANRRYKGKKKLNQASFFRQNKDNRKIKVCVSVWGLSEKLFFITLKFPI